MLSLMFLFFYIWLWKLEFLKKTIHCLWFQNSQTDDITAVGNTVHNSVSPGKLCFTFKTFKFKNTNFYCSYF